MTMTTGVSGRLITVKHAANCLTCDERIPEGGEAYWAKDIGVWHKDCNPPRSIKVYAQEAAARKQRYGRFG